MLDLMVLNFASRHYYFSIVYFRTLLISLSFVGSFLSIREKLVRFQSRRIHTHTKNLHMNLIFFLLPLLKQRYSFFSFHLIRFFFADLPF